MTKKKMKYPLSWLILIRNYLRDTGRKCVSYRGLRTWIYRSTMYRDLEWHTVERALRRLAEDGYLQRIQLKGNKTIYCPKQDIETTITTMIQQYKQKGIKM